MTNGSNHWILCQPDQVRNTDTMARGTEVLFAATSDRLPSHPTKDGRATDCCFVLIGAQCRTLMVDAGCPAASKSTASETLVVSASTISMLHCQGETGVCDSSILCWMTGEMITGCCK